MTVMDGDDMQRLWSLIEDLTNQLQANRQLCESLQQQADQLRGQAIHSGTGFALRRFNTDLSKEKFESELEALNAHLVKENLSLSQENKQQAVLLREYENTLETVMAKFRSFSHSTQQHTLQLTQHYESLLAQTTHNAAEQTLAAETAFSGTLTHLGALVRRAMQSLDGEVSDDSDDQDHEGASRRKPKRGWSQDPKWYGSGGYTGKTTDPIALRADEALEQLTEEERLRMENDTLRELLGLKERSDALISSVAAAGAVDALPAESKEPVEPKPLSPAERRASLTVDEAAIAAEASGQPSLKALQVSSTTRPGEESIDTKVLSPSRVSPNITPILDRKDQIIEEAILADDENETERGRRSSGDANSPAGTDAAAETSNPSITASLPLVFAADDADTAPSSIEELRAATSAPEQLAQVHATLPTQSTTGAAATAASDADEITPIDEVDLPTSAEPAAPAEATASAGPNMLAEAAPPALVSTGIDEADAISSKTTVTSASGIDVTETPAASTAPSSTTISSPTESSTSSEKSVSSDDTSVSSSSVTEEARVKPADVSSSAEESAPPASSAEGDFQPISASTTTTASEAASKVDAKETVLPAEPAKEDNASVSSEAATEAQLPSEKTDSSTPALTTDKAEAKTDNATPSKDVKTPSTPTSNPGGKNNSATPGKKGGRGHRGKGNRHNKSNSNASNKSSS